ncbi:GNAT family N-acetyltransferase [Nonomuraea sp. NPDC050556]|uniref:GNAT family N-acetyltransferase n=1 Tax=Nonomuraea sp. NPDC050556 TaxID=3364369 RepID=UPI00378B9B82
MTTTPLPGGLALRQARPADFDQIAALLEERGDAADAVDHRLVVEDEVEACAVVVDGDRVVSTATLLDEELYLGGARIPAGQVELVATDRAYEGRGLVRALMGWAHERSKARGHLAQVMIGIPYFYRLFGYEYAIDIPPATPLRTPLRGEGTAKVRQAVPTDLPALTELQDAAQSGFDVRMPHSPARRRWLLAHDASTTWVVERGGKVVATGRTGLPEDGEILLAEAAAVDEEAALDLLRGLPEAQVRAVERAGTVTERAWRDLRTGERPTRAEQYYVRIPDVPGLLERLQPVFRARADRDFVLSTFGAHYRIPANGKVTSGGPMQSPGSAGAAGVAPDQLPALLFGPLGIDGLSRIRPDVYPGPDEELFQALFPPLTADLLTYYLPY